MFACSRYNQTTKYVTKWLNWGCPPPTHNNNHHHRPHHHHNLRYLLPINASWDDFPIGGSSKWLLPNKMADFLFNIRAKSLGFFCMTFWDNIKRLHIFTQFLWPSIKLVWQAIFSPTFQGALMSRFWGVMFRIPKMHTVHSHQNACTYWWPCGHDGAPKRLQNNYKQWGPWYVHTLYKPFWNIRLMKFTQTDEADVLLKITQFEK